MPFATASHAVIHSNTLTNTLVTFGSARTISRPFAMTSAEAPPPISRKFAGRTQLHKDLGDLVDHLVRKPRRCHDLPRHRAEFVESAT
jgi:hypothetical protein